MKISKSKRQLAQLIIESGVTKFPDGANWAAQCSNDMRASFYCGERPNRDPGESVHCGDYCGNRHDVKLPRLTPNWHQAVLSRDEFDQIVAETAPHADGWIEWKGGECPVGVGCIPEPATTPTLDQLLRDWRNADDYAKRKQTEADEAAAMRDERWQAVRARSGEFGLDISPCDAKPEA